MIEKIIDRVKCGKYNFKNEEEKLLVLFDQTKNEKNKVEKPSKEKAKPTKVEEVKPEIPDTDFDSDMGVDSDNDQVVENDGATLPDDFEVDTNKQKARENLNIDKDKFTILLAEGGYGIGKMEKICNLIIEKDLPITLLPLCGKNKELFDKFSQTKTKGNTVIKPIAFTPNVFEYIVASDLFCGKSGASMIAEPCFFGVPQVITKHATNIEKHIAEYYVNYVKSAINEFNPYKVVEFVEDGVTEWKPATAIYGFCISATNKGETTLEGVTGNGRLYTAIDTATDFANLKGSKVA